MANEGLLIILRPKVVVWNKWRVENPDVSVTSEMHFSAEQISDAQT